MGRSLVLIGFSPTRFLPARLVLIVLMLPTSCCSNSPIRGFTVRVRISGRVDGNFVVYNRLTTLGLDGAAFGLVSGFSSFDIGRACGVSAQDFILGYSR